MLPSIVANLVHNEQIKLFATLLNTIAAASATIGVISPFSQVLFGGGNAILTIRNAMYAVLWLTVAFLLHVTARYVLRGLRE